MIDANGIYQDTVNYDRLFISEEQSDFDRNLCSDERRLHWPYIMVKEKLIKMKTRKSYNTKYSGKICNALNPTFQRILHYLLFGGGIGDIHDSGHNMNKKVLFNPIQ